MTANSAGCLPLHSAVQNDGRHLVMVSTYAGGEQSTAATAVLLRACPAAASVAYKRGNQPLHVAVLHKGGQYGAAVVKQILDADPQAAAADNLDGDLSLHMAAEHQGGRQGRDGGESAGGGACQGGGRHE